MPLPNGRMHPRVSAAASRRPLTNQSECLNLYVHPSVGCRFTVGGLPMKTWLGLVVFVGMLVCLPPARQSRSDEPADETAADQRLQAVKELLEQSIDWYDVLPEAEATAGLRRQVVLRWRNAVRTNT